jgi:hypothetical protein
VSVRVAQQVPVDGAVGTDVSLDGFADPGGQGDVAVLTDLSVFQSGVGVGDLVDLFVDAVSVVGDDVVQVDRRCFAVAQAAAAHQVSDQTEGVVARATEAAELGE